MKLYFSLYLFILIELIFVTIGDIKHRKISNLWSFLNITIACVLFILFPEVYHFGFESFAFSLTFFVVGFLLFLLKIMGGGDSKFLATFFMIIPLSLQEIVFYYLLLCTIFIGLASFVVNTIGNYEKIIEGFKEKNILIIKSCFGSKFAYAPVILSTWIWMGWLLKDQF